MTDPPDKEAPEPWQRFTLLDAFLLQAGFAVGFSVTFPLLVTEEGWIYRTFSAVAFGVVVAGPTVLTTQWTLRGRRTLPTLGEQLWLAAFVCWTAGLCLAMLLSRLDVSADSVDAGMTLGFSMCALMIVQTVCSGAALRELVRRKTRNRGKPIPCNWTDRFGSLACLSVGLWLWTPPLIELVGLFRP